MYREPLKSDLLDPADLFGLTSTLGIPLTLLTEYSGIVLGVSKDAAKDMDRIMTFIAQLTLRINEVVDFDAYEGDLLSEHLVDYVIEWPDCDDGSEPAIFVEQAHRIEAAAGQVEDARLTLVDRLVARLCQEFLTLASPQGRLDQAPLLANALLVDEPDLAAMLREIDNLLWTSDIPLKHVRYARVEGGEHLTVWTSLDDTLPAYNGTMMSEDDLDTFLQMINPRSPLPVTCVCGPRVYSVLFENRSPL